LKLAERTNEDGNQLKIDIQDDKYVVETYELIPSGIAI
jgi:hypothetical protein